MSKFFEEWKNIKSSFREAKRNIVNSLNIFDKFFCSFRNKIPANYLMRLGKTIDKYLNYFNNEIGGEFIENSIFKTLAEFIKKYNLEEVACTVYNSFVNAEDIRDTLRILSNISTNVNNAIGEGLLQDLESACNNIFGFYYFGDNNYYEQLINEIRTPTLFLGNLLSGNMPFAEEKIEEYEEKEEEALKDDDKFIDQVEKMNEVSEEDAFKSLILLYFKRKGKMKDKDIGKIEGDKVTFNDNMSDWLVQSGVLDELKKNKNYKIIITLGQGYLTGARKKVYFKGETDNFFDKVLNNYKLYMKKKNLNSKLNEIKKNEIINEIDMKNPEEVVKEKEEEEEKEVNVDLKDMEKQMNKELFKKFEDKGLNNFYKNTKGNIIITKAILKILGIPEINEKKLNDTQLKNLESLRKYGITDDITQKYINSNNKFLSVGASKDTKKRMLTETIKAHDELIVIPKRK